MQSGPGDGAGADGSEVDPPDDPGAAAGDRALVPTGSATKIMAAATMIVAEMVVVLVFLAIFGMSLFLANFGFEVNEFWRLEEGIVV